MPSRVFACAAVAAASIVAAVPGQDGPPGNSIASQDLTDIGRDRLVAIGERVDVPGFVVGGEAVDLSLERFSILASDATLVVVGAEGPRPLTGLDVVLLRGTVAGEPDSRVFVSVSRHGTQGFVRRQGELHFISTGKAGADDAFELRVTAAADVPEVDLPVTTCGLDVHPELGDGFEFFGGGGVAGGDPPCRVAKVAVETDWEYTANTFGEDADAAGTYAMTLIAAVSEIYQDQVNTRLIVSYLRLWEVNVDPYNQGSALHNEFREYWNDNEDDVDRDIAHLLSGRTNLSYGGIAWLSGLCSGNTGYGVSAYLNGTFPYPLEDNHGGNWDLVVVSHELGHNFGTVHTHDFEPPIDGCAFGQCDNADEGTIMSYCHTCSGGISNIALSFHPIVRDTVLSYLDSVGCDLEAGPMTSVDDTAATIGGATMVLDVLLNDTESSCDGVGLTLTAWDGLTPNGGTVELIAADSAFPRDRLMYTAPNEYDGPDTFTYTSDGGVTGNVIVDVYELRTPDVTGPTAPGVKTSYYELQSPTQLPDFDALTPFATEVVDRIQFPSTPDAFAGSGLSDEVGAVFEGYLLAFEDALYTLYLNSDDGSRLYIGDTLVVDNDGLHGMVEVGGQIALAEGKHELRIEFFENGGGAGVIASITDGVHAKAVIPDSLYSYGIGEPPPPSCPADATGDGVVDVLDLTEVLVAWGSDDDLADLNDDGHVDIMDLLLVILEWGEC